MKKEIKEFISTSISIVAVVVAGWLLASFWEINSKNDEPNPTYWKYNAFVMFLDEIEKGE